MMSEEIITGCIQHKDRRHLRLYCDYMQLYKLNEHKAKIVRVLETWTDSKRNEWYKAALDGKEQGQVPPEPDFWITMSFQQFRYFLYETASVDTIKKNVSELVEKDKHIQRRVNPDNPYGPPQYLLNYKALQKSLNKLPSPSFLPDIPSMEDTPPGEKTPPPENQPLPQGSKLPPPRGENYPHPRGENTPPSNNRDNNTSNNNEIDYVSADAERTPASSEIDQEQAETWRTLQAGLIASGVIGEHDTEQLNNNPIATTDTPTTLLQAEQERENHATSTSPTNISSRASLATGGTDHRRGDVRSQPVLSTAPEKQADPTIDEGTGNSNTQIGDSHNGHGGLRNHGTGDSGDRATLLPLVPAGGGISAAGTQQAQEVIPIGVDKSLMNGDKSSKGKKPVVPTGPLVMPPDDAKWCAETAVQMIEARKGRRYGETTRKQELAKATEALRYEIDGKPITRAQFTRAWEQMESWPLWVEKHITPMIKHLVKDDRIVTLLQQKRKATSGAVRHGPGAEMIEYEGEMMTRDEANKRGYSDFDRYIGNGKAERDAMIEEAMKDPLFYEIINDGRKVG